MMNDKSKRSSWDHYNDLKLKEEIEELKNKKTKRPKGHTWECNCSQCIKYNESCWD